jgi:hypothetical protein
MIKDFTVLLSGSSTSTIDGSKRGFMTGVIMINHFLSELNIAKISEASFYGHDYSLENEKLVKKFYPEIKLLTEQQPNFEREHLANIRPFDKYETGIDRAKMGLSRATLQGTSAFSFSRSKVTSLIETTKDVTENGALGLLTRWDIGYRGSFIVNTPRACDDIVNDKINLPYYKDNDTGFADMWIYGPLADLKLFADSYNHYKDTIYGKNDIHRLIQSGWPYSSRRNSIKHKLYSYCRSKLPRFSRFGIKIPNVQKFIEYKWHSSAYKSSDISERQKHFEIYYLLNNHLLLKAFVLDKLGLSRVNFLREQPPRTTTARAKFLYEKETVAVFGENRTIEDFQRNYAPLFSQYCDVQFYQNSKKTGTTYDCHRKQYLDGNLDAKLCKSNKITKILYLPADIKPNPSFDAATAGLVLLYLSGTQFNYMNFNNIAGPMNCNLPGAYRSDQPDKKNVSLCIYEIDFLDKITDGSLFQCPNIIDRIKAMPLKHYEMAQQFALGESDITIQSSPVI